MKEHIDRRTLKAHERSILDLDTITGETAPKQHVEVARSDERQTWLQFVAVLCLPNADRAELIQPVGKGAGKHRRDVLGDEHTGTVLGKISQNSMHRFGPPG